MKNKLGIIGGLILSLFIAGSALADTGKPKVKTTKSAAAAKMVKAKTAKPKKHRKHHKLKRALKKAKVTKTAAPTK
jgi:hypothetical protein